MRVQFLDDVVEADTSWFRRGQKYPQRMGILDRINALISSADFQHNMDSRQGFGSVWTSCADQAPVSLVSHTDSLSRNLET